MRLPEKIIVEWTKVGPSHNETNPFTNINKCNGMWKSNIHRFPGITIFRRLGWDKRAWSKSCSIVEFPIPPREQKKNA